MLVMIDNIFEQINASAKVLGIDAIIFENKHRSSVEVKINHVFLLVCQQEQGKIP